jgi:hypothetical protein
MKRIGLLFTLAMVTGSELEGRPAGTQLAQGRDIHAPHIVWQEQQPLVLFDRLVENKTDMHAMAFDGEGSETAWNDVSTSSTWLSGSGILVAEQAPNLALFTLQSPSPTRTLTGDVDSLQNEEILFHQGASLAAAAFLTHLPDGEIWNLGSLDQQWLAPDGRLYYLSRTGIFRTLKASDSSFETADRLATRFMVAPDQTHAVVRERPISDASEPSEVRDRVIQLPALRETATLPLRYRECFDCTAWLGFSPDSRNFYYAENDRPESTTVHQLDVQSLEEHSAVTRPGPSVTDLLWSSSGERGLLGDQPCVVGGAGCRSLVRNLMRPGPSFEPLSSVVVGARFSHSGKYLLFEDALIAGRLMVASTESLSPEPTASAVVLEPEGSTLDGATFESDTDAVVFWARPLGGKSSINLVHSADRSNLYAAIAPDFVARRLAESVDAVAVGLGYVLALVRFSPQDLTGDLVLYDLRSGREHNLASPVSSFWVSANCPIKGALPLRLEWRGAPTHVTEIAPACPDRSSLLLTFVVRGRVKSSKDGLWSLRVPL